MPERPTATLVITQGEEPDEISLDLKFEPELQVKEQVMAYHAMLIGYTAIIRAVEPKEEP